MWLKTIHYAVLPKEFFQSKPKNMKLLEKNSQNKFYLPVNRKLAYSLKALCVLHMTSNAG